MKTAFLSRDKMIALKISVTFRLPIFFFLKITLDYKVQNLKHYFFQTAINKIINSETKKKALYRPFNKKEKMCDANRNVPNQ